MKIEKTLPRRARWQQLGLRCYVRRTMPWGGCSGKCKNTIPLCVSGYWQGERHDSLWKKWDNRKITQINRMMIRAL